MGLSRTDAVLGEAAVHDGAVLDELDLIDFVASANVVDHFGCTSRIDGRPHWRTIDREIHLDPVPGERIGAPRANGFHDGVARMVAAQRGHQAFTVSAGESGMIVA